VGPIPFIGYLNLNDGNLNDSGVAIVIRYPRCTIDCTIFKGTQYKLGPQNKNIVLVTSYFTRRVAVIIERV
jgi:hypothetical protein